MSRLFPALFSLALGCAHASAGTRGDSHALAADELESHCARASMGKYGPYRMPLANPVTDPESMSYLADFPFEARRTARAAGLEPLLVAILREKRATGNEPSNRLLSL